MGPFSLISKALLTSLGIASGAYVCLRLFFRSPKSMLDLKSERFHPVHGCTDTTLQSLDLLFPSSAEEGRVSQDNVRFFTRKDAQDDTSPASKLEMKKMNPRSSPEANHVQAILQRDGQTN